MVGHSSGMQFNFVEFAQKAGRMFENAGMFTFLMLVHNLTWRV